MRRLIDDPHARDHPLEILEQKISVFKKTEHAQVHANAGDQPTLLGVSIFCFADLTAEPEIHGRRGKKKRGERRIPCPVKNVTRDDEQIFPRIPSAYAPIESDNDYVEDDESERIKKHGRSGIELRCRKR